METTTINLLWQLPYLGGREARALSAQPVESLRASLARSPLHKATDATSERERPREIGCRMNDARPPNTVRRENAPPSPVLLARQRVRVRPWDSPWI